MGGRLKIIYFEILLSKIGPLLSLVALSVKQHYLPACLSVHLSICLSVHPSIQLYFLILRNCLVVWGLGQHVKEHLRISGPFSWHVLALSRQNLGRHTLTDNLLSESIIFFLKNNNTNSIVNKLHSDSPGVTSSLQEFLSNNYYLIQL